MTTRVRLALLLIMMVTGCRSELNPAAEDADCAALDEQSCTASSSCHSVYTEDLLCASAGCASHFSFCADGQHADCGGQVLCRAKQPRCDGDFVVSVTSLCYEGCVHHGECQ